MVERVKRQTDARDKSDNKLPRLMSLINLIADRNTSTCHFFWDGSLASEYAVIDHPSVRSSFLQQGKVHQRVLHNAAVPYI